MSKSKKPEATVEVKSPKQEREKPTPNKIINIDSADSSDSDLNISGSIESFVDPITDEEHLQILDSDMQQAVDNGYMLPAQDYARLHYEDPLIVKLKQTNVMIYNVIKLDSLELVDGVEPIKPKLFVIN